MISVLVIPPRPDDEPPQSDDDGLQIVPFRAAIAGFGAAKVSNGGAGGGIMPIAAGGVAVVAVPSIPLTIRCKDEGDIIVVAVRKESRDGVW
ncbi:Uncharacterized protein BM_BM10218 [Brugia malayi]|uniref:Bm10218 n=2 Tax=Brugia TaxID=6278 RepID=A0A0K0IMG0_BRUMA|nr:Uncharacterized protein BM_BM10218 [Brugia malayi]CDQ04950.1 Bm10218 [Brugia malayi]VIO89431.1 Uncharacterized protein BM_BM10218 [Brugia malayi]